MPRRPNSLVLALDLGSSSLRAALFTERGERILQSTASQRYAVRYTAEGGAELDPAVLLRATRACLGATLRARRDSPALRRIPISAVAGSAFWHSLLGVDHAGRAITPVFMWADSRSVPDAAELRKRLSERQVQLRTGCMLRAPFWPAKLCWLRRTRPALFKRTAQWVSPASWIFAQLFGTANTSHSMASGTGLYNLRQGEWDRDLCDLCDVRPEQLGVLGDSSLGSGRVAEELREATIFAAIGDGAAGNLGCGADAPGRVAINIGTSGAVREIQSKQPLGRGQLGRGLFNYVVDDKRVVVGGAISNGGNLHRWCMDVLQIGNEAAAEKALSRNAAATDKLTVLPFWVTERAPTWPEDLAGTIIGLTAVTSAADILRAVTTSTYYRLAEILELLPTSSPGAKEVIVSGGILHSPASLRILADTLGSDLRICRELESSLRGAAIHALHQLGHRVAPLRPGRIVRHRPALAEMHRRRRLEQNALERLLSRTAR